MASRGPDFQDWRDAQTSFAGLAAWSAGTMNVSDEATAAPSEYSGAYFSANAFRLFGARRSSAATSCPRTTSPAPLRSSCSAKASGRAATVATRRSSAARSASTTCRRRSSASCRKHEVPGRRPLDADVACARARGEEARRAVRDPGVRPARAGVSRAAGAERAAAIAARLEHDFRRPTRTSAPR